MRLPQDVSNIPPANVWLTQDSSQTCQDSSKLTSRTFQDWVSTQPSFLCQNTIYPLSPLKHQLSLYITGIDDAPFFFWASFLQTNLDYSFHYTVLAVGCHISLELNVLWGGKNMVVASSGSVPGASVSENVFWMGEWISLIFPCSFSLRHSLERK